jgi:SPP1 family phage portal protein
LVKYIRNKLFTDTGNVNDNILSDIILSDSGSVDKIKKYQGSNYYNSKNDIVNRKQVILIDGYEKEDTNKSNYKVTHNFHRILVDQKCNYLLGKPIKLTSENNNNYIISSITTILGDQFNKTLLNLAKNASNKGDAWLYVYINEDGMFKYIDMPSEQLIPLYDSHTEELKQMIRYYDIHVVGKDGSKKKRYRVEIYDKDKITYYVQDFYDDNKYNIDLDIPINPVFYFNIVSEEAKTESLNQWSSIPFIQFKNNDDTITDLEPIKELIDSYDLCKSDFANNLADIQDAIWVLKNYEGESLSEFMINLKTKKAINVGDNGGAEPKTFEIPYQAREVYLKLTRKDIYEIGRGVDNSDDRFSNAPSGVSLKHLYANLDLKCDDLELEFTIGIKKLLQFVIEYLSLTLNLSYSLNDIAITFNRNMSSNTSEMITSCKDSLGIISNKTILENHPFVKDLDLEYSRLKEEQDIQDERQIKEQEYNNINKSSNNDNKDSNNDILEDS